VRLRAEEPCSFRVAEQGIFLWGNEPDWRDLACMFGSPFYARTSIRNISLDIDDPKPYDVVVVRPGPFKNGRT
jgi:hypothetical protein